MTEPLKLNTIHHGDCLDLMRHIPDGSVDMILCDLPYGTTQNKWDAVIPFDKLWHEYERIIKSSGAVVLTSAQPFTSVLVSSNLKMFKYELVWDKRISTGFLNAKKQPLRSHESILVFYKKQATYNPQFFYKSGKRKMEGIKVDGKTSNYGEQKSYVAPADTLMCYPLSILPIPQVRGNCSEKVEHPTQKPVALFEYLIRTYTNEGEIVLDNCAGSGTTAIAALNTGRQFICIEQEEKYVAIGNKRIAERPMTLQL